MPRMESNRALASWLIQRRPQIEERMNSKLGAAAPSAGTPETETLRRFRSYSGSALMRERAGAPPIDGLRPNERRALALLRAWVDAAAEVTPEQSQRVHKALDPLVDQFRLALRSTPSGRRAAGAPRASRRAVVAAIDRVSDAFLAIDCDSGQIVDANPAAGALLGVSRDALLAVDAMAFVPDEARPAWDEILDAITEGQETRSFETKLRDVNEDALPVAARVTGFSTRRRTLALVMARPQVEPEAVAVKPAPPLPPSPTRSTPRPSVAAAFEAGFNRG